MVSSEEDVDGDVGVVQQVQEGEEGKIGKKKLIWEESKKTWHLALPAVLTSVAQFSIEFVTAAYVGRLGNVQLAAVSEVQIVLLGFIHGVMLGMGSALETLCGQAVGAGKFNMLGIYMQRSCIITGITATLLIPIHIFTSPILKSLHQNREISNLAGKYAIWIIPQLYAHAFNYPLQKFLQSQSKVWVMTILSILSLGFHALLNWVLVIKLDRGLYGAAIAGDLSWWVLIITQLVYIISGFFPDSWTGFSCLAFKSLANFVKLSLSSALMLCLELWYVTAVILMVGGLKDADVAVAVDAASICINLHFWTLMLALGFNASVSVRVSNELGAGKPKAAKLSIVVHMLTTGVLGIIFASTILATRNQFPRVFTDKPQVIKETSKLGYLLAASVFLNGIQPVLLGVAVGAGWQFPVAILNVICYYGIGLPIGALLGFKFKLGVHGIWWAMLGGSLLQTIALLIIVIRTNWHKQSLQAEERVKEWGGQTEPQQSS